MTTTNSIVVAALRKINAIDANEPVQPADFEACRDALNRMMMRWEANGTSTGWTPVTNPGDVIPAPIESENAIIYNLAADLSVEYGMALSPVVAQLAKTSLADLERDVFNANSMRSNTNAPGSRFGRRWNMYTDCPNW